jgi:hypothetical protein
MSDALTLSPRPDGMLERLVAWFLFCADRDAEEAETVEAQFTRRRECDGFDVEDDTL